jgi:hypothetical protein
MKLGWLSDIHLNLLESQAAHEFVAVAVVGDEAQADARLGNGLGTLVALTDFLAIDELSGLDRGRSSAR